MKKTLLILSIVFTGCIGTDVVDDPIVPQVITINESTQAIMLGDDKVFTVTYFNEYGIEETISPDWFIEDTEIASVSSSGVVTAKSMGQTSLIAKFDEAESEPVLITVTGTVDDVATVIVEAEATQVDIGASIQLIATPLNILENELMGLPVSWSVNDNSIASINQSGLLTGKSQGVVNVTATVEGIKSDPFIVNVGGQAKITMFSGESGYTAEGTATLSKAADGTVTLYLAEDFKTSFALGTFIYLSNFTSGGDTKAKGLDLGEIKENGAHTFNVTALDSDVDLTTYRYVIILCKPAAITFGIGDFQE
ncbi:Ig-like domain-containing protein [Fulvivirga lutimaris]|uniref:Ig-like domain-containing protein n=1 Tax=Fulvivirga lutimaris TaxID=1819566 RepID=UPI0012BCBFD9|nr:Ig-like domain-containing protein [Fulvivirga lutimaris]MTI41158.1 hypothetical protein [Fulvivirga lutimaris]